jgi:flagellar hook assembly protein FlgD
MPNPFGGRVALTFTLARGGDLEAGVFDVLGRQVRSFRREGLGPGDHVLQWDGRNADGHGVPAGVYLVRYRVGDVSGATRVVRIE